MCHLCEMMQPCSLKAFIFFFSLNLASSELKTFIKVFSSEAVGGQQIGWYWDYYRDFLHSLCFCQQGPLETALFAWYSSSLQSLWRQMTKGKVEGLSLYSFLHSISLSVRAAKLRQCFHSGCSQPCCFIPYMLFCF